MKAYLTKLQSSFRSIPRGVWVLIGGQFVNRLGSFVYPFLAIYLNQAGYSAGGISAVLAAMAVGQFFAPFAGGYLADAMGRRNTIVVALCGGATTMLAIYAGDRVAVLCLAAAMHGFASHAFGPAANALITDLVPQDRRQITFTVFRLAINAGFSLGPAIAGVLFALGPRYIFLGDAATTLVFAFLAVRYLPHGLQTVQGDVTNLGVFVRSWVEAARDARQNPPFLRFYGGMLLMTVAFLQIFTVLSLHAVATGLTLFQYGLVMGFNGLIVMCCELPATHLTQQHSPVRMLTFGMSLIGVGCAFFGAAHSLPAFFASMAVFTAGEMLTMPVAISYASLLAPEKYRGRYFGILGTTWGVGSLCASLGPVFYHALGPKWWVIAGAVSVLGALVVAGGARRTVSDNSPCGVPEKVLR